MGSRTFYKVRHKVPLMTVTGQLFHRRRKLDFFFGSWDKANFVIGVVS